jgi:hypothetical protein
MLIFAWTARPDIPWVVPLIGLTVSIFQLSIFYVTADEAASFS